ncbi:hypothetical protein G9A89_021198 [Geosiphon pyriformis]|nr:hypothetical protein G9A89_021198 [Geosiphon pyriformis]
MVDTTGNIKKIEITNNIHSLVQQLFQLIQHQEMEITINQQTIQYQNTKKTAQHRTQKKTENTINKIIVKVKLVIKELTKESLYQELIKETWNWWIQQFPRNYCYFYLGQHMNIQNLYMNKTKQLFDTRILQQLEHFNRPEILLNKAMNMITSNQLEKITNAQFEELQTQITQVIFENKIQEILQKGELTELDFDGAQY